MKIEHVTFEDFCRLYPNLREMLDVLRPPPNAGPEYDEQRKAYDSLLHAITACYSLWSVAQPMVVSLQEDAP